MKITPPHIHITWEVNYVSPSFDGVRVTAAFISILEMLL
jgi:hypothetical protein